MQTVQVGEKVKFICQTKGRVAWYKGNETRIFQYSPVLKLKSATLSDSGYYWCKGIDKRGISFVERVSLQVIGKQVLFIYYVSYCFTMSSIFC